MEIQELEKIIKDTLSEERYYHSKCVMQKCEELAKIYNQNTEKAKKIGIAHDIAKEMTDEEKVEYCIKNSLTINMVEKRHNGLLHAKIGADICRKQFGFDEEMCKAIEAHTTGKENMTELAKILYISDAIGDDRKWRDVEEVRKMASRNLNEAMLYMLNMEITERVNKNKLIHTDSILTRNEILNKIM